MLGNELLHDRLMRDHRDRMLSEADRWRRARAAGGRRRSPARVVVARLGGALVTAGRRLQALDPCADPVAVRQASLGGS